MVRAFLRHAISVCALLVLSSTTVHAQIPRTISYQGALFDSGGAPLADGEYGITFDLYDAVSAGSPVWTETHVTTLYRGVFTVYLGSIEPLDVDFSKPYWVEIQRDGEAPLLPRLPFTAAPYAMIAERSLTADVADRAQTATTADRATVSDSSAVAGKATTAQTAQTATSAETAVSAQTAVIADTARFVDGDFVTSVNDATGAIAIKGAGATQVTTNGNEITISSIDGEDVSAVLYAPSGTQKDLTEGSTFLFDVGYGALDSAAAGARIASRAGGLQGPATALTLVAEGAGTGRSLSLDATGDVEVDGTIYVRGQQALRLTRDPDSTSILIGPGAGINNTGANNVIIGRDAFPNGRFYRTIAIGDSVAHSIVKQGHPSLPEGTSVLIGYNVAKSTESMYRSVVIGYKAMENADSIRASVAIGLFAGRNADSGSSNVFLGSLAGQSNNGTAIVSIGSGSGQSGAQVATTMVGYQAGSLVGAGELNVYLGANAGNNFDRRPRTFPAFTSESILIGTQTEFLGSDTLRNATAIGSHAQVAVSNAIVLGATTRSGKENAMVGIGTTSPRRMLDVNGDARIGRKGTTIDDIILLDTDEQPGGRIQAGQQRRFDIDVDGATVGASVTATPYPPLPMGVMVANAYVEFADNVRITLYNFTGTFIDIENTTFKLLVVQ